MAVVGELTNRSSVVVVAQVPTEWAGLEGWDDEELSRDVRRYASESYLRRESRLSEQREALERDLSLGDADVEIFHQDSEWAAMESEDSDDEDSAHRTCAELYTRREQRLSAGVEALKEEIVLGDADVEVVPQSTEWAGLGDSDDEDNVRDGGELEERRRAGLEARRKRDLRISMSEKALQQNKPLADREVEVLTQPKEWAGAADANSDDEEESPRRLRERHAQDCYLRREIRLSLSQKNLDGQKCF